jgi:hypothetical protein
MSTPSLRVCGHSWRALRLGQRTVTGLKALAKNGTAVQEVFFVTGNPQAVRERLSSNEDRVKRVRSSVQED